MIRKLTVLLFVVVCYGGLASPVMAASDVLEVYFLPLQEAAAAVKTQLSDQGRVAAIASRRMLIVDDDTAHINRAKQLLKRLDHPAGQYAAFVSMEDIRMQEYGESTASVHAMTGKLAGGWIRLAAGYQQSGSQHRQSFQLRVSSNQPGSMETGTLQSFGHQTRLWLAGYGIVQANSVELVPVTSGFHITVIPAGSGQVRVRIVPWMQRAGAQIQGQHEMLFDLGSSNHPATPPSNTANMRLNTRPVLRNQPIIEVAGAATELVIPVDQSITIAASSREARQLGNALLSRYSSVGKRQFVIHLRVSKSQ